MSGIALGLLQTGWQHDTKIVAAQMEHGHLFEAGVKNDNKPKGVHIIDSEGHDLGVRSICQKAMFWAERFSFFENEIESIIVKDETTLKMCIQFANQHHILIEPLCAVAVGAVYDNPQYFSQFENICIVVCGGNHCHIESFRKWKQRINVLKHGTINDNSSV